MWGTNPSLLRERLWTSDISPTLVGHLTGDGVFGRLRLCLSYQCQCSPFIPCREIAIQLVSVLF